MPTANTTEKAAAQNGTDLATTNKTGTAMVPAIGGRIQANKLRRATSVLAQVEPQGDQIFSADAKAVSEADCRLWAGQLAHQAGAIANRDDQPLIFGAALADVLDALVWAYDSTIKQVDESQLDTGIMQGLFVGEMSTKAGQSRNYNYHRVMRHALLQVKTALLPLISVADSPYVMLYNTIDNAQTRHFRAMQVKPGKK